MPDYFVVPGPAHIHPFANVLASNELIFVSGLASPVGNVADQTRAILDEAAALLGQVGSSLNEVVRLTITVTDRDYADEVSDLCRELLPDPRPAAGTLRIAQLVHPDLKVEFDFIAHRGAKILLTEGLPENEQGS